MFAVIFTSSNLVIVLLLVLIRLTSINFSLNKKKIFWFQCSSCLLEIFLCSCFFDKLSPSESCSLFQLLYVVNMELANIKKVDMLEVYLLSVKNSFLANGSKPVR